MENEHKNCRYRFWTWLIRLALRHRRIYWLLWGVLAVGAVCAWRFGLAGLALL